MWLHLPTLTTSEACRSVQASEASTSDCTWRSPDTELWALSSETLSPRRSSWRGWRTRPWHRLLSGTTYEPSTADHGAAAFISSQPVIHANPFRVRGTERAPMIPATFGRTSRASSKRADPSASFSKTSPGICPSVSETSAVSFKAWASGLRRASYQQRKSARLIPGKGSSFWATPTTRSAANRACVAVSPTGVMFRDDANQAGSQTGLGNQAQTMTLLWELLDAAGLRGTSFRSSHPVRTLLLSGEPYGATSLALNPAFADWMMGWPSGWSEPMRPVTGWSHWLRRARTGI